VSFSTKRLVSPQPSILGVDIGSVAISLVQMDPGSGLARTSYAFHQGLIAETLAGLLETYELEGMFEVACTSSTPQVLRRASRYDSQVAFITAARHCYSGLGAILIIGGERFALIRFDDRGGYQGLRANSSCAAGTGGFLDQQAARGPQAVEVEIYASLPEGERSAVYRGLDIGSTSTKAVLIDGQSRVRAGFYTRTAGQPIRAVRGLFEAVADVVRSSGAELSFLGVAVTGSGRKFIGKLIGADLILDEITAHARAAVELDPETDTIIEIGGQDSKFTLLRKGRVVFSQMNTVCAAGTGSFLEEQAVKLGIPLDEYAARVEGAASPLASDRCTVFMERDINYYLSQGYTASEILASCLFSVRENYLLKVAAEARIGRRVCFQGATAKNKALVAAFEQKLKRPITVSPYCAITGALGAALTLADEGCRRSSFRGLDLYREEIPVRTETCELCTNRCRLSIATVRSEEVAYGLLCGRDYGSSRYVARSPADFDLVREWNRAFHSPSRFPAGRRFDSRAGITVGLPAALHLFEELPLWKRFFTELGVRTVTSEHCRDVLKSGKSLAGAEFCAPITALHGHVRFLAERAEAIFLPFTLRIGAYRSALRGARALRSCYYTQFSPAITATLNENRQRARCLMPLLDPPHFKTELLKALRPLMARLSLVEVSRAYEIAARFYRSRRRKLKELCRRKLQENGDISVLLLGRPYTLLPSHEQWHPVNLLLPGRQKFLPGPGPARLESTAGDSFPAEELPLVSRLPPPGGGGGLRPHGPALSGADHLLPLLPRFFCHRVLSAHLGRPRQALPHPAAGRARFQRRLRDAHRSRGALLPQPRACQGFQRSGERQLQAAGKPEPDQEAGGEDAPAPQLGPPHRPPAGGQPAPGGHRRPAPVGERAGHPQGPAHQHRAVHPPQHYRPVDNRGRRAPRPGAGEDPALDTQERPQLQPPHVPSLYQEPPGSPRRGDGKDRSLPGGLRSPGNIPQSRPQRLLRLPVRRPAAPARLPYRPYELEPGATDRAIVAAQGGPDVELGQEPAVAQGA